MTVTYHHLLSYHLSPEGHFSFDFRKMREVSVIFEQRGHMPAMQTTETKTCRWNKDYFTFKQSLDRRSRWKLDFLCGKANIITQKIYSPVIKSGTLVCRFFGHSTFPVTPRCHLRHCGSHDYYLSTKNGAKFQILSNLIRFLTKI